MNILEQIKLYKDTLTPRELEVYNIVMDNPYEVSSSTTSQIVARYHVSQSSISRFCQKVGYNSYSDFRMALYLSASTGYSQEEANTDTKEEPRDLIYYMGELTKALKRALPDDLLDKLAEQVLGADTVYVAGAAYSSIPAQLLALQLMLCSVPAHYATSGAEVLHITKSTDIFILFSAGNPTHTDLVTAAREISPKKRPHIILVTLSSRHPLRNMVDTVVYLPSSTTMHYPIAVDNSYVTTTFCNIFSNRLMTLINGRNLSGSAGEDQ